MPRENCNSKNKIEKKTKWMWPDKRTGVDGSEHEKIVYIIILSTDDKDEAGTDTNGVK
jgi:hypothetical protein